MKQEDCPPAPATRERVECPEKYVNRQISDEIGDRTNWPWPFPALLMKTDLLAVSKDIKFLYCAVCFRSQR